VTACWAESPRQPPVDPAPAPAAPTRDAPSGDASVEQRTAVGGTVSLSGNRSTAKKRADVLMSQHCGEGAFAIVREGEEVIEATNTIEWRVHYECNRR
jgi:hypothetical protein